MSTPNTAPTRPSTLPATVIAPFAMQGAMVPVGTAVRVRRQGETTVISDGARIAKIATAQAPRFVRIESEPVAAPAQAAVDGASLLEELLNTTPSAASPTVPATPSARAAVASPATTQARPGRGATPGVDRPLTSLDFDGNDSFASEAVVGACRTVPEMVKAAGLDWTVSAQKFKTEGGVGGGDLRAIVRDDIHLVMAVRSDDFRIAQADKLFAPLQPLVDAGATFRGAGSFRDGRTVWAQVHLGDHDVLRGDRVQMFAHVRDGRDGTHCWSLQIGSVRIVCANTLLHACQMGSVLAKSKHGSAYEATIEGATAALAALRGQARSLVAEYQRLAAWRMAEGEVRELLGAVLPRPAAEDEKKRRAAAERQFEEVMAMIQGRQTGGYSIDGVLGTGWGALNGITDWADHSVSTARNASRVTALRRQTEGTPSTVKTQAYEWLTEHCPVPAAKA